MAKALPPATIAALKEGIREALEAKELCRKGQVCGYEMGEHEAVADQIIQRSQATLQNFGDQKRADG